MKCNECSYKETIDSTNVKCTITMENRAVNADCNCESARVCRDNKTKVTEAQNVAEEIRNALRDRSGVVMIPKEDFIIIYNRLRDIAFNFESTQLSEIVEALENYSKA